MKRIALLAVTAVTAFAPLAVSSAQAAPPQSYQQDRRDDYRDDRRDERQDARRDYRDDRRDDRRDARQDARQRQRWDARQHNGYSVNGRWHYGAPPASYYNRSDFRPGYQAWKRGVVVPAYYRDRAHRVDYRQYRNLRAPPRGYEYIRDDRGTVLLVGVATGVILSAIFAQ